ncbi:hypothetical protein DFH06DRAFT_480443 [Mycena polygramma]|nr:hypothetical protein DFH06DRAFT_480443 [Mycena polygramma]
MANTIAQTGRLKPRDRIHIALAEAHYNLDMLSERAKRRLGRERLMCSLIGPMKTMCMLIQIKVDTYLQPDVAELRDGDSSWKAIRDELLADARVLTECTKFLFDCSGFFTRKWKTKKATVPQLRWRLDPERVLLEIALLTRIREQGRHIEAKFRYIETQLQVLKGGPPLPEWKPGIAGHVAEIRNRIRGDGYLSELLEEPL